MYQNNSTRQTAITPPNISVSRRFRTLIRTMSEFITGNRSVVKDNVRKTWKMCKTIYTTLCTSSFVNNHTHNYTVLSHHFTDRFYFSIINLFPTSFRLPPHNVDAESKSESKQLDQTECQNVVIHNLNWNYIITCWISSAITSATVHTQKIAKKITVTSPRNRRRSPPLRLWTATSR